MKRSSFLILLTILLALSLSAQEKQQQEMSAEQKAWNEFMTPGDMHKMLGETVGEWKIASKWWMYPDAEPEVSTGSAETTMIMGGRYQKSMHEGSSMGMPFEGMSIMGYDKAKDEFVAFWIDNMGTGFSLATGKYDEEKKALVMNGVMSDPVTKNDLKFKMVTTHKSKDESVMEMFMMQDDKEFKSMEMVFTRR